MQIPSMCAPLPAELWGQILGYMDDFSLWVPCRQVSRMLRSEAEYEFTKTRLSSLKLLWRSSMIIDDEGTKYKYTSYGNFDDELTEFRGLEDGGTRARFKVIPKYNIQTLGGLDTDKEPDHLKLQSAVLQALRDADLNFQVNRNYVAPTDNTAVLGFFSNNNPLPALEIDLRANECSFEWKSFLDVFYGDYAYVGKITQPHTAFKAVVGRTEAAEREFLRGCSLFKQHWVPSYGRLENSLFERAYMARLKRVGRRAGIEPVISARALPEVKRRIEVLRMHRNSELLSHMMRKYGYEQEDTT